jgi:hypothetical protein
MIVWMVPANNFSPENEGEPCREGSEEVPRVSMWRKPKKQTSFYLNSLIE